MTDLIDRIEAATGSDRELDAALWYTCIEKPRPGDKIDRDMIGKWPRYTASIDAAMGLARHDGEAFVMLSDAMVALEDEGWPKGEWVKTLPRYICAAALKARESEG